MLCVTNDGRKIGLDQRLINPLLPMKRAQRSIYVSIMYSRYGKTPQITAQHSSYSAITAHPKETAALMSMTIS